MHLYDSFDCSCKSCNKFIYCSEKCREDSWNESHQFECVGIQTGFLVDHQDLIIIFRGFLKGVKSKFRHLPPDVVQDLSIYGDKNDNYGYFQELSKGNALLSNVMKKVMVNSANFLFY